jgi:antitoxin CptB
MGATCGDLERRRLRWRARRGLLENDLLLTRFFDRCGDELTETEAAALAQLLALPDNDLLDLLLSRKSPEDALDTIAVHALLERIRSA